jgi:hypothetical protein
MKYLFSALLLLALTMTASAHHSRASYDMNTLREPEGELLEIMWRNPHGGFRLRVTNERQEQEDWTIEGWGSLYTLERTGVSAEDFQVGDRVRSVGYVSTRLPQNIFGTHMLLASGTEAVLRADADPYWVEEHIGGQNRWAADESQLSGIEAENLGIFRVWSPSGYAGSLNTMTLHAPFTASAVAARASWDPYDNFVTRCEGGGMPGAMMAPHPFRFEDRGTEILLHGQVWDITRTISMDSSDEVGPVSSPNLGRSAVGKD